MPHIQVQATPGLAGRTEGLARELHHSALGCGHFPQGGVRTLVYPSSIGMAGPEEWDAHYVQVFVRIAPGRAEDVVQEILETLFTVLKTVVEQWKAGGLRVGYQLELSEFDKARVRSGGVIAV
ncbi:hypothetical protein ACU8MP_25620 (plasmid) [Rhizobium leguminosarum]